MTLKLFFASILSLLIVVSSADAKPTKAQKTEVNKIYKVIHQYQKTWERTFEKPKPSKTNKKLRATLDLWQSRQDECVDNVLPVNLMSDDPSLYNSIMWFKMETAAHYSDMLIKPALNKAIRRLDKINLKDKHLKRFVKSKVKQMKLYTDIPELNVCAWIIREPYASFDAPIYNNITPNQLQTRTNDFALKQKPGLNKMKKYGLSKKKLSQIKNFPWNFSN